MKQDAPKPITDLFRIEEGGQDLRWVGPVHECPYCEFDLFHVLAKFSEGEVAFYFLDAVCARCGSTIKIPTPEDVID
jgi:DNA-directed RNA polymerase subunit RPC12/RpoP